MEPYCGRGSPFRKSVRPAPQIGGVSPVNTRSAGTITSPAAHAATATISTRRSQGPVSFVARGRSTAVLRGAQTAVLMERSLRNRGKSIGFPAAEELQPWRTLAAIFLD